MQTKQFNARHILTSQTSWSFEFTFRMNGKVHMPAHTFSTRNSFFGLGIPCHVTVSTKALGLGTDKDYSDKVAIKSYIRLFFTSVQ